MRYCALFIVFGFPKFCNSVWPAFYEVNLRDKKTFVISAGEEVDEEEEEEESRNEMIQAEDLREVAHLLKKDEERYKPLHSHVEHYNRRSAEAQRRYGDQIPYFQTNNEEMDQFIAERPFVAGFKHQLDKEIFDQTEQAARIYSNKEGESPTSQSNPVATPHSILKRYPKITSKNRSKRAEDEDEVLGLKGGSAGEDLVETLSSRNQTLHEHHEEGENLGDDKLNSGEKIDSEGENEYEPMRTGSFLSNSSPEHDEPSHRLLDSPDATHEPPSAEIELEAYDYENFRAEYSDQLEVARRSNSTFNLTESEEPEESAKDAIRKIVEFEMPRNCTKEELTQFGVKALECLAFDYQHSRNSSDVKRVLQRTWTILRVWICIYVCVAVPCWFQKGWCCCCFRCKMCFPDDVIARAKHYYAENPPGVMLEQVGGKKGEKVEPVVYKPTIFEIDAYEDFESAIRNL